MIQEPVQPTATPPPTPPRARRSPVVLAIAACLSLALPLAVVIAARPSVPAPLTAGASAGTGASTAPGASAKTDKDPGKGHGPKADKTLRGNGELKSNGAGAKGGVTITAVNGSSVTLATVDGWTRTVVVTSSTALTKGGQSVTVSDLHVGDAIRFHQVRNADGSFTVDAIAVLVPQAGGEVTAVDATTITVRRGGSTRVIKVTGATAYVLGSAPAAKADVTVGSRVEAQGSLDGDSFTASKVTIHLPEVGGEVVAKSADSITIKHADGSTTVIHVTSTTTYEVKGKEPAALADISVGDRVSAEGKKRADGSLDAVSVEARAPKSAKPDKHAASPGASPG